MKEFVTAAQKVESEDLDDIYVHEFTLVREFEDRDPEKVICRAREPKDGQLAVLMATSSKHSSMSERIAGVINFFVAVLDRPSHEYVVSRLLDPEDEFGIEEIEGVMEWMVEQWTGRPTKSRSGSTTSPKRAGQKSTRSTPALT